MENLNIKDPKQIPQKDSNSLYLPQIISINQGIKDSTDKLKNTLDDSFEKTNNAITGISENFLKEFKTIENFYDLVKQLFNFDNVTNLLNNKLLDTTIIKDEMKDNFSQKLLNINESNNTTLDDILKTEQDILNTNKDMLDFYRNEKYENERQNKINEFKTYEVEDRKSYEYETPRKSEKKLNIGKFFSNIFGLGKEKIGDMFSLLSPLFSGITGLFSSIYKIFKIFAIFDGILEFAHSLSKGKDFVTAVKDGFNQLFNTLLSPVYYLSDKILGEGKSKEYITKSIDVFFDWVNSIGESLGKFTAYILSGEMWSDIKTSTLNLVESISNQINSTWNYIKTSTLNLVKSISDWINSTWDSVKSWWGKFDIKTSTLNLVESISNQINSTWDSIKKWWNKFDIKTSTLNLVKSISDWINSTWDSVKSWWGKFDIKTSTLNLVDGFYNIIDEFVLGLKSIGYILSNKNFWKHTLDQIIENFKFQIKMAWGAITNGIYNIAKYLGFEDTLDKWGFKKFNYEEEKNKFTLKNDDIQKNIDETIEQSFEKALNNLKNVNKENLKNNISTQNQITIINNTQNTQPIQTNYNNHQYMMTPISTDDNTYNTTLLYGQ